MAVGVPPIEILVPLQITVSVPEVTNKTDGSVIEILSECVQPKLSVTVNIYVLGANELMFEVV